MSSKPNTDSFVAVLKKSGLVESDRLQKAIGKYTSVGGNAEDSARLAEHLITNGILTRWQAEKLLQGKHKGYFLGKYRLLSLLGKGGMSSVYLAEHTLMRRRCALKVLPTKRVKDTSYLARFHREAQAVASLDHPNIVRAYDVDHQADRDNEIHFLVMEYVEGDSLQELVQKYGVCSFLDAAEYARQSALGLHHAHEAGMVHRDVKPGNLLVDPNGVVKVLDLGLARFFTGDEAEESLTVAHDEKVLGTADYLAPEQALDSHTVDARADIYGLGCTLFFMLTGRPPFTEGTLTQRLMAHQTKTPPTVESLRPDTPGALAAIVRKMMEKKAEDRYATAKELADALFKWIDENTDDVWRVAHSDIYGTSRKKDSGTNATALPVAKPVLAIPVTASPAFDFTQPAAHVSKPRSTKSGSSTKLTSPSSTTSESVDPELSNFFASISGAPPAVTSKSPATQPTTTSLSALKQPPHLAAKSSRELPATTIPESDQQPLHSIETSSSPVPVTAEFPDFNSTGSSVEFTSEPALPLPSTFPNTGATSPSLKGGGAPNASKSKTLPVSLVAGVSGVFFVLLLLVAYLKGWLEVSNTSSNSVSQTRWPNDKREVTVGRTNAEYRTITDALKAVRVRFAPTKDNDFVPINDKVYDQMVIKIAAGTYRENISIDGSLRRTGQKKPGDSAVVEWPKGIKLQGDGKVILESGKDGPKDGPVVRLRKIERFVIEGIEINAAGSPTAVELSGDMKNTQLRGLTLRGFTETGVSCRGTQGFAFGSTVGEEVVLDQLRFEPDASATNAVGVKMREYEGVNTSYVIARGCRFIGPMAAGIMISGSYPFKITVAENIFSQAQDGVRFDGSKPCKDIVLVNNTFHDGRHGISFMKMPGEGSRELVFRRNLFSGMQVADGLVQEGYDEKKFKGMISAEPPGMDYNWSDRAAPTSPAKGEISGLFAPPTGRRGETGFAFASTESKDPKFLAPSEKSVQSKVDLSADPKNNLSFEKPWIGAVGP